MATPTRRVPEGCHSVSPHLVARGGAQALEFYKKAFGAKEIRRSAMPDGKLLHAEMQFGDSRFYLNDEFPEMGAHSPQSLKGTPVTIHLWSEDVDSLYKQATAAGAQVVMPLADQFWGDRYGVVRDPFGHHWSMASHVKDLTPEQLKKAGEEAMAKMGPQKGKPS
jgi:PhnB protein